MNIKKNVIVSLGLIVSLGCWQLSFADGAPVSDINQNYALANLPVNSAATAAQPLVKQSQPLANNSPQIKPRPLVKQNINQQPLVNNAQPNNQPMVRRQPLADTYQQATQVTAAAARAQDNAQPLSILLSKIDAMQQQIQQLRGQLEVQAHDLKLIRQQHLAFYNDLDSRLTKLINAKQNFNVTNNVISTTNNASPALTNKPIVDDIKASYEAAFNFINQKNFPRALQALQLFLQNYPTSTYAPNAHYWLGELYLLQRNELKAISEFTTVIKQFPKSTKFGAALLKLGVSYQNQGQLVKAKQTFLLVRTTFKDQDNALVQLANMHLRNL